MNPLVLILFLLALTSATVALVLGVAWSSFGRARHALSWATASAIASLGWTVNLAGVILIPDALWYAPAAAALMLVSPAFLLAGYRQRAGLAPRSALVVLVGLVLLVPVAVGGLTLDSALLVDTPPLLFGGGCLILSVVALLPLGRVPSVAERTAAIVVGIVATFYLAAVIVGIATLPIAHGHSNGAFRTFLMLGMPAGFVANGFACVLVLAADLAERMGALAATDPLTGALNRRGLEQAVAPTIANCRRRGEPVALVVADLDRFKSINDRLGHAIGDAVLQRFAAHVTREIRAGDLFARLGGEEFAIVLPGTSCASAAEVIDRVRRGVPALCVEAIAPLALTASFGITSVAAGESDLAGAFDRADRALYASKLAGRDRVTVAGEEPVLAATG